MRVAVFLVSLALVGCTSAEPEGCSASSPEACAYVPDRPATPFEMAVGPVEISYTDVTGATRSFAFEARLPEGSTSSTPVVIWSHGGSSGKDDPSTVGTEIGELVVSAGYVFIAVAHYPHATDTYEALCQEVGEAPEVCRGPACSSESDCEAGGVCGGGRCRYFKPLNWDRPHDIAALIDQLVASDGPLAGRADASRIVYAGHSGGAGGTLMVAGAVRQFGTEVHLLADPRPIAFISASPQGPGDDGFLESSFDGSGCREMASDPSVCLTRPRLSLTGIGDDTMTHMGENRRRGFELTPDGDQYLLWNTEEAGRHTTFEYKTDSCLRVVGDYGIPPERCDVYLEWQRSAILAFLDAHARDDAAARAYLTSDNLTLLSEGAADWVAR